MDFYFEIEQKIIVCRKRRRQLQSCLSFTMKTNLVLKNQSRKYFSFQVQKYLNRIEREGTERVKMFLGRTSHHELLGIFFFPFLLSTLNIHCNIKVEASKYISGNDVVTSDNHCISHILGPPLPRHPRQLGLGLRGSQAEHGARGHSTRGLCPRLCQPFSPDGAAQRNQTGCQLTVYLHYISDKDVILLHQKGRF